MTETKRAKFVLGDGETEITDHKPYHLLQDDQLSSLMCSKESEFTKIDVINGIIRQLNRAKRSLSAVRESSLNTTSSNECMSSSHNFSASELKSSSGSGEEEGDFANTPQTPTDVNKQPRFPMGKTRDQEQLQQEKPKPCLPQPPFNHQHQQHQHHHHHKHHMNEGFRHPASLSSLVGSRLPTSSIKNQETAKLMDIIAYIREQQKFTATEAFKSTQQEPTWANFYGHMYQNPFQVAPWLHHNQMINQLNLQKQNGQEAKTPMAAERQQQSTKAEENVDCEGFNQPIAAGHKSHNSNTTGTDTESSRTERIKRPMNAFMIWSQQQRRKIFASRPELTNTEVSKRLGEEWHEMNSEEKAIYYHKQAELSKEHMLKYPHYRYKPRPKRVRSKRKMHESPSNDATMMTTAVNDCSRSDTPAIFTTSAHIHPVVVTTTMFSNNNNSSRYIPLDIVTPKVGRLNLDNFPLNLSMRPVPTST